MDTTPHNADAAPRLLEVAGFEHSTLRGERVLLRLDGRYLERPGKRILEATLFVDDGLSIHRHSQLPDLAEAEDPRAADDWLWRAAFAVPASYLSDARTSFALQADPGGMLDLPYPVAKSAAGGARPLSLRAAHTARRYAAAVAILVTVAVAPGGLPADARTEVIKVTKADGTVVYVTSDGRELAQLPEDGVITESQVLPPPAPEPAATAPDTAAQPKPAKKKAKPPAQTMLGDDSSAAELTEGAIERPARKKKSRSKQARRPLKPRHAGGRPAVAPVRSPQAPEGRGSAGGRREAEQRPAEAAPQQAAPSTATELLTLPQIVTQQVGDETFVRVERPTTGPRPRPRSGSRTPAPRADDTKSLSPLVALTDASEALQVQTPSAAPLAPLSDAAPAAADWEDAPGVDAPEPEGGEAQEPSTGKRKPPKEDKPRAKKRKKKRASGNGGTKPVKPRAPLRHRDGSPTRQNPGFFDALPGPSVQGVPNFVIRKFQVPLFLLPIYQAAGIQYGIRWELLAAINEIETDYGRNLNVSSAGALGWMQFMPPTWKAYGVDANKDGKRDPYNPVDAIFAAARYLKASGAEKDVRKAVFAYNRADWYVDSVLMRAKLIAGVPGDVVGSLTGLTEGRFPVAARARYADDLSENATKAVKRGQNAANVVSSDDDRRSIDIFADKGSPVVAVNDGIVKKIGRSKERGLYLVLQDVYGNRYTYSGLGSVADLYPVPRSDVSAANRDDAVAVAANDPKPRAAASAGVHAELGKGRRKAEADKTAAKPAAAPPIAVKERLFAHPSRPKAKAAGGLEQLLENQKGFETYDNYFVRGLGLNARNATLRRLRKGSRVVASTILGRVAGARDGKAARVDFEIRPAGRGAPRIDPKPILDGWKLLESTAIYRANGENVLYGEDKDGFSIGQILLLSKPLLEKRVLSDERIDIYPGGREDIRTGQIDRRVLATMAYLAESGMRPTITSLASGRQSLYTASGNLSAHPSGNAVDIGAINGIPLVGGQNNGGVGEQVVRRLMQLQGTVSPAQIISLNDFGANTLAMADHASHIHVGFRPLFGANSKLGRQTLAVLQPGQWDDLLTRLRQIDNPHVSTKPSRYALPVNKSKRASGAPRGE